MNNDWNFEIFNLKKNVKKYVKKNYCDDIFNIEKKTIKSPRYINKKKLIFFNDVFREHRSQSCSSW